MWYRSKYVVRSNTLFVHIVRLLLSSFSPFPCDAISRTIAPPPPHFFCSLSEKDVNNTRINSTRECERCGKSHCRNCKKKMMIKIGARTWRCKEACTLTTKLLNQRSGVHSTPDDSFRGTQTKYLRLRIALDTLYSRMRVMCDSATVYAENLSAVAQALMEAPLCLDDREERQEFSRRAAKMFDETNAFS